MFFRGGTGRATIYGGVGDDSLDAGEDGATLYGKTGNDTLIGSSVLDEFSDGVRSDIMLAGAGDDRLWRYGYSKGGVYFEVSGSDTLDGGEGDDSINIVRDATVGI